MWGVCVMCECPVCFVVCSKVGGWDDLHFCSTLYFLAKCVAFNGKYVNAPNTFHPSARLYGCNCSGTTPSAAAVLSSGEIEPKETSEDRKELMGNGTTSRGRRERERERESDGER